MQLNQFLKFHVVSIGMYAPLITLQTLTPADSYIIQIPFHCPAGVTFGLIAACKGETAGTCVRSQRRNLLRDRVMVGLNVPSLITNTPFLT